ncbi:MAG TPA: DUF4184 family protein [Chitinophagaceae bacterium]|nr:DUF4184 family protein [Chitinophagaceae bacterium]
MPFTFSHPAIVLPATKLPKKYYSMSSLITGSMTPDFEYFIRMRDYSRYSHTIAGMFWFDLPLGLALLFIFHNIVRDTLIRYMPFIFNVRFSFAEKFNWNNYFRKNVFIVLISLLVGIGSHLLWDSFTHHDDYFAETIPFLNGESLVLGHSVYVASILQFASSIAGGIIIIIFIVTLPEGKYTGRPNILNFWLMVTFIMIMVINARLYIHPILNHHFYGDAIVTIISAALIGILIMSALLHNRQIPSYKHLRRVRNRQAASFK